MIKLSVNINKIATIRNARGGNSPSVQLAASRAEQYGAYGITVHPRPDERHITYADVRSLSKLVITEFNIEGYPSRDWLDLVIETKPTQATLVPDAPDAITSNAGWDTIGQKQHLKEIIEELKEHGIRTSLFTGTELPIIEAAAETGADRIELYTEPYAIGYEKDKKSAVLSFSNAALFAHNLGLGINAGHDLSLENLKFFAQEVPHLDEVSIGHALISDALYFGLENTIQMYLAQLT